MGSSCKTLLTSEFQFRVPMQSKRPQTGVTKRQWTEQHQSLAPRVGRVLGCKCAGQRLFSLALALSEYSRLFVCYLVILLPVLRHWTLDKPGQINSFP